MSISTAKQFVAVLQKSRLLKPKHLDAVRAAAQNDPNPKALAGRLVKKELLSRWQARQLLAGHASFFLGEYRLIEPLSAHSGSHVYLAEHKTLGRRVVLKRLPRDVMSDADRKKRLLGAVRAAVGVEHENLARVYSIEQAGDRYYVISQYVEGRDLAATVADRGPLAFAEAAAAVSQAASGLAEAHRRKAVHGGVRPSNLVIGPDGLVKLVSIATARRYETADQTGSDGDTPAALDAVDYQAPELAKPDASPTPASDVYSLGCTLYYLLTGKSPFAEGAAAERAAAHARHQPPGILRSREDAPDLLVKACRKMLAKRPEDRPGSADEVAEMLAELCPAKPSKAKTVATASARAPKKQTEEGKAEKEAGRGDKNDVKAADEDLPSRADQSPPPAESEELSSDVPAGRAEDEEYPLERAEADGGTDAEPKTPERRPSSKAAPAAVKPAAKPAARRPPPRGAAGERDEKVPGKPSAQKAPSPKPGASVAIETGGADSPAARAKSRAGKNASGADKPDKDETIVATSGPEGFLKTHRKWLLIGGGSAAALLLILAVTLPLMLGGSSKNQAGTETAAADSEKAGEDVAGKPARAAPHDVIEELDLAAELDLDMDLGIDDAPVRRSRDPEPDEEPETPAEDEKDTEEKEPSGEKNGGEPADPDKKPDAVDEKPDEPEEKPSEDAKPDEAEEKPAEKPAPPKKEKPPTFRDFPETVELPLPIAVEGQPAPTEPITLGKLYVRERAPWIVVLSGGEVVVPNAEIEFSRGTVEGGSRAYIVQLTRGGETTAIGRLWFEPESEELKFQWLEAAAETQDAGLLRLCQINLTIDGESRTLALSKPAPAPPLEFDFDKKTDRVTIDSESLPDDKLLRLEITGIEGADPKTHPFQANPDGSVEVKRPLILTLQRMDRHRNPQGIAQLRITLSSARKGLTIVQRIEQPPRRMVPPNPQLPMVRQKAEEEFAKLAADLKKAQGSGERDKFLRPMDQIEQFFGQADLFELIDKQAKIHYRILLQAGNHQIPLFDSQIEGPAGGEPEP